jgi:CPA1 family monovalent cation:H+ antiporter
VTGLEIAVGLLIVAIALALLAQRLDTPRPLVLAIGGVVLGFFWQLPPAAPPIHLPPGLVLALFLPPVLAWASFSVPLGAFRANLLWILLLAIGLVVATMAIVAVVAHALVPAVPWAAAFALGALVAPPDPVAATSIAGELGLRNRLVTILEGEGLINDAVSIVLYSLAIQAVVTGHFSWGEATLDLLRSAPIGILVGLVIGWLTALVRRRVDDPVLETTLSLVVPYVAYIVAGRVGGSEVLSVVALGLYLRREITDISGPATRLVSETVWRTVDFAAEGILFLLVGAAIGDVAAELLSFTLLWQGVAVSAAVIALRLVWMHLVPRIVYLIAPPHDDEPASGAERTVLGWAGMRGVISLALALAIPRQTASGAPLSTRGWLVLVAFIVIFITLIVQGLTLAPLIRWLGAGDPDAARREELDARRAAVRAASERVDQLARELPLSPDDQARVRSVLAHDLGLARTAGAGEIAGRVPDPVRTTLREALIAERDAVLNLRDSGAVSDEVAQQLETELNLDLLRLERVVRRRGGP